VRPESIPFASNMSGIKTPAFVFDEGHILKILNSLQKVHRSSGAKILYSVKACPMSEILKLISPLVNGFSVSSLFEARLASEFLAESHGLIHITSPGFRAEEMEEIFDICSTVSFNSIEQWDRLTPNRALKASVGFRVNPQISFLADERYDPCRRYSKLGVPLESLVYKKPDALLSVEGIHFHNMFEGRSLDPLIQTVDKLSVILDRRLNNLRWINFGGGYLLDDGLMGDLALFIAEFRTKYDLDVYLEPGKAIVGGAGSLVTRVIDRFERDGKNILVLDSGVHHLPEVFEYQRAPSLLGHSKDGSIPCVLVGSSCLAGDIFGEFLFNETPAIGDEMIFENVGAYSLVKASRFNGHDFPSVYQRNNEGHYGLIKRYGYNHYRDQWAN